MVCLNDIVTELSPANYGRGWGRHYTCQPSDMNTDQEYLERCYALARAVENVLS